MGAVTRSLVTPSPVVLYSVSSTLQVRRENLMVLVQHRNERLMDLADQPDALIREGFADYDTFRRYWRKRTHRPYRPLARVEVFTIRPWLGAEDETRLGRRLLQRLYGDYLD